MSNKSQNKAKAAKNNEFYTQLTDIEKELRHYKEHFKDKVVYCNCDDPLVSNFVVYFIRNFEHLGLKKLITTCYRHTEIDLFGATTVTGAEGGANEAVYMVYEGDKNGNNDIYPEELDVHRLKGDGDFRSAECIELLKQADIVCTNPPFSLFRDYVGQLMKYNKKFLIIGSEENISYKDIFPLMKEGKIWLGYTRPKLFLTPLEEVEKKSQKMIDNRIYQTFGNICWFTNLEISKTHEKCILYKSYNPDEFPKYVNYDAISVNRVADIPCDYDGLMGVPISFMEKYCPEQFELIGSSLFLADMSIIKKELGKLNGGPRFYERKSDGGLDRKQERIVIKRKPIDKV